MDSAAAVLVVFAKYPEPGRVKTRLIGPLTPSQAAELHRLCLLATWWLVSAIGGARRILAITPDDSGPAFRSLIGQADNNGNEAMRGIPVPVTRAPASRAVPGAPPSPWQREGWREGKTTVQSTFWPQGDGSLGRRLERVVSRAFKCAADRVILLGCDSPTLEPHTIHAALAALDKHDMVLGPATDGGYYLLGLRRPIPELFRRIDWGACTVADQTRSRARQAGITWHELPPCRDLDRWDDLVALSDEIPAGDERLADLRAYLADLTAKSRAP